MVELKKIISRENFVAICLVIFFGGMFVTMFTGNIIYLVVGWVVCVVFVIINRIWWHIE